MRVKVLKSFSTVIDGRKVAFVPGAAEIKASVVNAHKMVEKGLITKPVKPE